MFRNLLLLILLLVAYLDQHGQIIDLRRRGLNLQNASVSSNSYIVKQNELPAVEITKLKKLVVHFDGTVTSQSDKSPIEGAAVELVDNEENIQFFVLKSDSLGKFKLDLILDKEKQWLVRVRKDEFKTFEMPLLPQMTNLQVILSK
jgi:hypothetical protein